MDETMKSHMGRCLTIHDKLKTDVIAAKRSKLSQRDIAKSEKNTLEHIHTVIPMRISMREVEIFKWIDRFYDFFHGSGNSIIRDRIFVNKTQRELK